MVYRVEYIFGDVTFVDDVREIKSLIDSVLSTERGAIRSVKYSPSILDRITYVSPFKGNNVEISYDVFYVTEANLSGLLSSKDVVSSINEILDRGHKIISVKIDETDIESINTDKIDSNL